MKISKRRVYGLVPVFFLLSGVTGLVYQIIWTRLLVKIIGGAPFAWRKSKQSGLQRKTAWISSSPTALRVWDVR